MTWIKGFGYRSVRFLKWFTWILAHSFRQNCWIESALFTHTPFCPQFDFLMITLKLCSPRFSRFVTTFGVSLCTCWFRKAIPKFWDVRTFPHNILKWSFYCKQAPKPHGAVILIICSWDYVLRLASPINMARHFHFSFLRLQDMSPQRKIFFFWSNLFIAISGLSPCQYRVFFSFLLLWVSTLSYQL